MPNREVETRFHRLSWSLVLHQYFTAAAITEFDFFFCERTKRDGIFLVPYRAQQDNMEYF
jgi:hypothetical protein